MKTCSNPACPDLVQLGLVGEYVDSVQVCPHCGTRLVETPPVVREPPATRTKEPDLTMVSVCRTADEGMTALVKSILDGYEIRYVVRNEGLQDLFGYGRLGGFNIVTGPAEFLVLQEDADRARALLSDTEGVELTEGE